jgi:hypothetical protein
MSGTERAVNIADLIDKQAIMAKTVTPNYKRILETGDNPNVNLKIPGRGQVIYGKVSDSDFQQHTNTIISATLTKKTIPIEVGELDASTTIEEWKREVMDPINELFSTDINKMVLEAIFSGVDSHILAASAGANFKDLSLATGRVIKSKLAGKRWGALDPEIMATVRTSGVNLFTGGSITNSLYTNFDIASYGGVEYIGTPDIDSVTYPAAGVFPSAISGTVANNAKQLPIADELKAAIPEGVLFTIKGCYRVDAEGKTIVGQPKTFVTAATPAGSNFINLRATLIFTPDIIEGGKAATQVKNVSKLPAEDADLTLIGSAGVTYLRGVIYSEKIAAIANRPITERGKTGNGIVSTTSLAGMASVQYWERIGNNANGDIWQSVSRLDAAFPLMGIGGTAYYVAA